MFLTQMGRFYLILEYCNGKDLAYKLSQEKKLSEIQAL